MKVVDPLYSKYLGESNSQNMDGRRISPSLGSWNLGVGLSVPKIGSWTLTIERSASCDAQ